MGIKKFNILTHPGYSMFISGSRRWMPRTARRLEEAYEQLVESSLDNELFYYLTCLTAENLASGGLLKKEVSKFEIERIIRFRERLGNRLVVIPFMYFDSFKATFNPTKGLKGEGFTYDPYKVTAELRGELRELCAKDYGFCTTDKLGIPRNRCRVVPEHTLPVWRFLTFL
jgi:hypothetical protein